MVFPPNSNPFFHPFSLPLSLSLVVCVSQVERCYYFLHSCVETAQRNEPVDGRLVQFLLSNPTNDGGQWDMLVNLIGQFASQISSPKSLCVCFLYCSLKHVATNYILFNSNSALKLSQTYWVLGIMAVNLLTRDGSGYLE